MFTQSTHKMILRSKKQKPKIKKSNTPKDPKSCKPYTNCGQWSTVLLAAYSEHFQHDTWAGLIYVVGLS